MKSSISVKLFMIILVLSFFGCNYEEPEFDTGLKSETIKQYINLDEPSIEEMNELLEVYAYLIASSLDDVELCAKIKNEANLRFDGDYDILTNKLESLNLSGKNMLVKELLASKFAENKVSLVNRGILTHEEITGSTILEIIKQIFPNLQVAVPLHCEMWVVENYIPLVTYIPCDYEEQKDTIVKAFNVFGDVVELSTIDEPNEPVIVVGISERIDRNGNRIAPEPYIMTIDSTDLKSAPSTPTSLSVRNGAPNQLIVEWSDVADETSYLVQRMVYPPETQFWDWTTTGQNDNNYTNNYIAAGKQVSYRVRAVNGDGYSAWSPHGTRHSSDRSDGEQLRVYRIKFSEDALDDVEHWLSGAPEIRVRVVKGSQGGASQIFESGRLEPDNREDVEEQWWNINLWICNWYTSTVGTILTFDWREEDPLDNVNFSISGSWEDEYNWGTVTAGGSVSYEGDKGGDHIGLNIVQWWEPESYIYNLTGFEYQFTY